MLACIARWFVIAALCSSIGVHWAALQSVAWATMLIDNAKHTSITEAIAKTFDGDHPCDLCKRVVTGQHTEKKSDAQPVPTKPDLICPGRVASLIPRSTDINFATIADDASARVVSPPTPPPRPLSV